jgi:hypothetical protein
MCGIGKLKKKGRITVSLPQINKAIDKKVAQDAISVLLPNVDRYLAI